VSELSASSDLGLFADGLKRRQVIHAVRAATFIGTLVLAWFTLSPFGDLAEQALKDATSGNEIPTYLTFGCLSLVAIALVVRDNMRGLRSLWSPAFVLFGSWMALTVVLSQDPSTSIRRFALTVCVIGLTAAMMLLPKSQDELMRWLGAAALILLAGCFLGVLLAPNLSTHLITDTQEPQLAGDWRGVFGHKNMAAGIMAMLVFIGIYAMRSRAVAMGAAIVLLASIFLVNTTGKSSMMLVVVVLIVTSLTTIVRSFSLRAVMLLTPLVVLNALSVGTVIVPGFAELVRLLPLDTSFTGRTDIWTFAVQSLQQHLVTGYGFFAFWGTDAIRGLPEGKEWAEYASHSHNGYLDSALAMGLPGLALLIGALVIAPLRNYHAAIAGGNNGPLSMMLLRIWLFGLYLSSFESFFLDRSDPLWFTFLLALFGLHYLARFRLREASAQIAR
jgi:O-antigen ligase